MPPTRTAALALCLATALAACASPPPAATFEPGPLGPTVSNPAASDPFAAGLIPDERDALGQTERSPRYAIRLTLSDDLRQVAGGQLVHYTNQETVALDQLVFHLYPGLIGGSASVTAARIDDAPAEFRLELDGSILRLPLDPPLPPGGRVKIDLEFNATIPADSTAGCGILTYSEDILSLSHIYPMLAVYDDEGWNADAPPAHADPVYADVAYFEATVDAPADLLLAASGLQVGRSLAGGRQQVSFAAGPVRDFHLAASRRFEARATTVGQTTLVSYAFPEFGAASDRSLEYGAAALAYFGELLGPYPYTELDLVSVPLGAMGVEYPGILSLDLAFYDPQDDSFPDNWFESVVAHEVAHQWIYGVVGNDQIDDPWLDESLVQYLTMRYFGERYGPQGTQGYRESLVDRWNRVDQQPIPIGLPVRQYTPLEYGAIVYGRGALFFEALADRLGPEATDAFLRQYYQSQRWGIATPETLQALAEAHCACSVQDLFEAWVLGD